SDAAFNFSLYILNATAENLYETSTPGVGLVDIRYNALLASESRGKVSIKLRQDPVYKFHLMPLIKLPEMYYIAAEHYTTANPTKAIDLLNTVRRSRRINVDLPNGLTNEQVANELFKEHRKEYVSEGQLFFYYKR